MMNYDFLDDENTKEEDLYKVLGCDETSDIDQIKCEYKYRVKKVHPDKVSPEDNAAKENYEKLRWAYDILSDEDSRKKYDSWRQSGLSVPFRTWLSLRDVSRTSMHWAKKPKKKLMLEDVKKVEVSEDLSNTEEAKEDALSDTTGTRNEHTTVKKNCLKRPFNTLGSSGLSRKFKNYEI